MISIIEDVNVLPIVKAYSSQDTCLVLKTNVQNVFN